MKSLILRFWRWLGRLLGQSATADERPPTAAQPQPTGQRPILPTGQPPADLTTPVPTVTLPPPLPPQMDLHTGEAARYSRKASILSKPEQKTYHALCLAASGDFQVMAKVRLWDFIWLVNEPPERKQHLNRLSCRHVDFLLCEPGTLKPLLVIELDDGTHQTLYAQDSDRYKDELFEAAGMPLLRLDHPNFPARRLRGMIEDKLGISEAAGGQA